ncbi:MAG: D-aminoacyl-tRNA deacylase [Cyanobacteria bacterium P01_C01_bin.69]
MRVLIQRVKSSKVTVDGTVVGSIEKGLNLLVAMAKPLQGRIAATDTETELAWMAAKCLNLRLFPKGDNGRFDQSVIEIGAELIVVSQFTLYGGTNRGRRPSFAMAAPPDFAKQRYEQFIALLKESGLNVETGKFGADMQVSIENDGPVTFWLTRESC